MRYPFGSALIVGSSFLNSVYAYMKASMIGILDLENNAHES
jgi:hypothetical protein